MVDPAWRSLRPPRIACGNNEKTGEQPVFHRIFVKHEYDNGHHNAYSQTRRSDFDKQYSARFSTVKQSYMSGYYPDIFKEDSVIEMQLTDMKAGFFMDDNWMCKINNKDKEYPRVPVEPIDTYSYNAKGVTESQEAMYRSPAASTSEWYNEKNNFNRIIVPTQNAYEHIGIHLADAQLSEESMSSTTNNVICNVNSIANSCSPFSNVLQNGTSHLSETERRTLKNRRKKQRQRKNRRDKNHVYIQCRLSKKLLAEIIKSSIIFDGNRLCL